MPKMSACLYFCRNRQKNTYSEIGVISIQRLIGEGWMGCASRLASAKAEGGFYQLEEVLKG
jgi:hypothetical protein